MFPRLLPAVSVALVAAPALAHVGDEPAGIDALPYRGAVAVETTVGVLVPDGDAWRWMCHEAVVDAAAFLTPRYRITGEGTWVALPGLLEVGFEPTQSAYFSRDGGCGWETSPDLDGEAVVAAAFVPGTPEGLAVTGALATEGFVGNAILRTADDGRTWSREVDAVDRVFRSVLYAADGTAWATSVWYSPPGAWVHRSLDGGRTWTEASRPEVPEGERWNVLDLLGTAPGAAYVRQSGETGDRLHLARDGGATLDELLHLPGGAIHDLDLVGDELWVATSQGVAALDPVASGVVRWVTEADVRGVLGGAPTRLVFGPDQESVMRSFDPEPGPRLRFTDLVGPLQCPDDARSTERCDPLWPDLQASLSPVDFTPYLPDPEDPACGETGCAGPGAALLLPLALPLWRRRDP